MQEESNITYDFHRNTVKMKKTFKNVGQVFESMLNVLVYKAGRMLIATL